MTPNSDEPPFDVLCGSSDFGGMVPKEGLTFDLHHDVTNPLGYAPMVPYPEPTSVTHGVGFLVQRGEVTIAAKVQASQNAGATCFVLINNDENEAIFNVGSPGDGSQEDIQIPVCNISQVDGDDLLAAIQEGVGLSAKLIPLYPHKQVDIDDAEDMQTTVRIQRFGRRLGIKIMKTASERYHVAEVAPDSAMGQLSGRASLFEGAAGILNGAQIVAINGKTVLGRDKGEVLRWLDEDIVELVVDNNNTVEVELTLPVPQALDVPFADAAQFTVADLGKTCHVGKYGRGVLCFIGKHHITGEPRSGIALEEPNGKNNGTIKGHRYFECKGDNYGVLCPPKFVKFVTAPAVEVKSPKKKRDTKTKTKAKLAEEEPAEEEPAAKPKDGSTLSTRRGSILKVSTSTSSGNRVSFGDDIMHEYEIQGEVDEGSMPYRAIKDYDSGVRGDLPFTAGTMIKVMDTDGEMWFGCLATDDTVEGSFPADHVESLDADRSSSQTESKRPVFSFGGGEFYLISPCAASSAHVTAAVVVVCGWGWCCSTLPVCPKSRVEVRDERRDAPFSRHHHTTLLHSSPCFLCQTLAMPPRKMRRRMRKKKKKPMTASSSARSSSKRAASSDSTSTRRTAACLSSRSTRLAWLPIRTAS